MDPAAVHTDSQVVKQAQPSQAPRPRPDETRRQERKAEAADGVKVEISDRARELHARDSQVKAEEVAPDPSTGPSPARGNLPLLVVRHGVAPVETNLDRNPEEIVREQLEARAAIRNLSDVLTTPDEEAEAAKGADPARAAELRALPGDDEAAPAGKPDKLVLPAVEATRVKVGGAAQPERPNLPERADAPALQEFFEVQEREDLQQADDRQDLEHAVAAAPQSGVARSEEESDRRRADVELMGDSEESDRERVAREVLTEAGVVEARSEEELVTRFAERAFAQDLGRPPRVQEVLGNRSRPTSDFDPEAGGSSS
jgi:hypothetical protein